MIYLNIFSIYVYAFDNNDFVKLSNMNTNKIGIKINYLQNI